MYTDNKGIPITPERMRALGARLDQLLEKVCADEQLDSQLTPLLLASMLIGAAHKHNWKIEQLFRLLNDLDQNCHGLKEKSISFTLG